MRWSLPFGFDVLEEELVAAHHAELPARALLDRFAALLEVAHFRGERRVARREVRVLACLFRYFGLQLPRAQPAALADPQRVLDQDDQGAEDRREEFHPKRPNASWPG